MVNVSDNVFIHTIYFINYFVFIIILLHVMDFFNNWCIFYFMLYVWLFPTVRSLVSLLCWKIEWVYFPSEVITWCSFVSKCVCFHFCRHEMMQDLQYFLNGLKGVKTPLSLTSDQSLWPSYHTDSDIIDKSVWPFHIRPKHKFKRV